MKDRAFFNWIIIFIGVVAITSFYFTSALADEITNPTGALVQSGDDLTHVTPLEDTVISDDSFGENYQQSWIPFSNFQPASSNCQFSRTSGYLYRTGGTDYWFFAGINLPSGAYLADAQVIFYDNDPGSVYAYIYRNSVPFGEVSIASCNSIGTPQGYYWCTMHPNETIQYFDNMYTVYVGLSAATTNLRFSGVLLRWKRQISPAPTTATFYDVPTNHPFFRHVEALARSGITSGCGGGAYCPNSPVTRGQMAVFLSKALGLHWPY